MKKSISMHVCVYVELLRLNSSNPLPLIAFDCHMIYALLCLLALGRGADAIRLCLSKLPQVTKLTGSNAWCALLFGMLLLLYSVVCLSMLQMWQMSCKQWNELPVEADRSVARPHNRTAAQLWPQKWCYKCTRRWQQQQQLNKKGDIYEHTATKACSKTVPEGNVCVGCTAAAAVHVASGWWPVARWYNNSLTMRAYP